MNKIKVKCAYCGKVEYVHKSRSKNYKCCSRECIGKLNSLRYNKKISKECPICGKEFFVKTSQAKRRICCSNECLNKYRSLYKTKENNPNYRLRVIELENGVRRKDFNRYKEIYKHVALDALNVDKIPKGYNIHHKDANSNNNDPKNLIILPKATHMLLHRWFGNILLNAIETNKISMELLQSICTQEQYNLYKNIIILNVTSQVVIKQGELLENLEVDNQQPSVFRNIYEGSTTNERPLTDKAEGSNLDTSALPIML